MILEDYTTAKVIWDFIALGMLTVGLSGGLAIACAIAFRKPRQK